MSQLRIVAVGDNAPNSTSLHFFDNALALCPSGKLRVLVVGSALETTPPEKHLVRHLGAILPTGSSARTLHSLRKQPRADRVAELLGETDLLYIMPGNSAKALRMWSVGSMGTLIKEAIVSGKVAAYMQGAGAAAMLFKRFCSDADRFNVPKRRPWAFDYVDGMGILPNSGCVEADKPLPFDDQGTTADMVAFMAKESDPCSIAIDTQAAVQITSNEVKALSKGKATVRLLRAGQTLQTLSQNDDPLPLEHLYVR